MASTPLVAIEAPTGSTGSDGLAVFTFAANIDTTNHEIVVGGLRFGNTIQYNVTGARQITFVTGYRPVIGEMVWLFNGTVGVSIATSLPSWNTVATIVSDAAIELGLISAAITDPFASTDPNILQLIALLKTGGRRLGRERMWTHLQKEYTFSTVASTATYSLPTDFRAMIDQTGWNRTTQFPLLGPTSPQRWQYLQAITGTTVWAEFRPLGGQLKLTPTPTAVQTIAFEYLSTYWIKATGQTTPTSDLPSVATDTVCFDPILAVAMLKLAWVKAKGLDTAACQDEYDSALSMVTSDDAASPVLSLNGNQQYHLIDQWNLPDTGYAA